jgi:excisionase family DNA binding protein
MSVQKITPETPRAELPSMLTVPEAAAWLRVGRSVLYEAIRAGQLPGVLRVGRFVRIDRDALKPEGSS